MEVWWLISSVPERRSARSEGPGASLIGYVARPMATRNVSGESMATSKKPHEQSPKGRRCTFTGCGVVLSVYNHTERCTLHPESKVLGSGITFQKPPPRRSKK